MPTINPITNHLENENNAQMTSALKQAKQSKKPNINRISKKYNVPRSTFQDHISAVLHMGQNLDHNHT